jgi:hypothetical protein
MYLVIDDESFGSVFLQFLTEYDAIQAHSLINYVMEHPNVDIDDVVLPDSISPVIYFNATAGSGGSYISLNGATAGVPYSSSAGSTFSTSIELSFYGYGYGTATDPYITKSVLRDLLVDYVEDGRDGTIEISDSNLIILGSSGPVESITSVGSYSLYFDISDLAQNGLEDVVVQLTII